MKKYLNDWLNKLLKTPVTIPLMGVLLIGFLNVIVAAISIFEIEILRRTLESVLNSDKDSLVFYLSALVIVYFLSSISIRCSEHVKATARGNIVYSMMNSIFIKNGRLKQYSNIELGNADRLSIAEEDCERYTDGVMDRASLFASMIIMPCYVLYGITINPPITISILVIGVILSFVNRKNKQRLNDSNEEYYDNYGEWSNFLWKALDNLEVIRVFLAKDKVEKEQRKRNRNLSNTECRILKLYLNVCLIEESSDMLFTLLVLCLSFIAMIYGKMPGASIIALVTTMGIVQKNIFSIPEEFIYLRELSSKAARIRALMNLEVDEAVEKVTTSLKELKIEGLWFNYGDHNVLSGIDYIFESGKFYILTGESGCGKSTFLQILAKLILPMEGSVKWNHQEIADISRNSLYEKVAYVTQSEKYIEGSIKENIVLGNSEMNDYEAVLSEAYVSEFLDKNNYTDSFHIGFNGTPLSSGERQMVSFAQIIYKPRQLILLDEAFSAVDPAKELLFLRKLKLLAKEGRIVILISHRPESFNIADEILYMSKGKICESGAYEELYNRGSLFYKWYKESMKGE